MPLVLPLNEHVPMVHSSLQQHVRGHHVHGVLLHVQARAHLLVDEGFPLVGAKVLEQRVEREQELGEGWVVE